MRIGIDIRSLMEKQYSGVGEYVYNLLDNLFKIDQENQYFLFYNSFSKIEHNLPKWNYENVKFIGFHWPNKIFNLCQKFLKYPKIDRLLGGVDIFFSPNWNFTALSKKCYKILTVHDLSFKRYPEFYSLKRRIWHYMISPKKLLHNFDCLIAVSENTKQDILALYKIKEEKIQVIHSGIKENNISAEKIQEVKNKFGLNNDFVLSIGTLEPRKNLIGLILAFDLVRNKFSNLELILAGQKGWLDKKSYDLICQTKGVRFLGYVSAEEKTALYKLAKIFVYPSFYEGFGFPVLEAMQSGCPVITSLNSSLPEIAGSAALLIDPYYLNDLASAMEQLLIDEELRKSLIAKGLTQWQKFSWLKTAEEVLEVFKAR